MIWDKRHEGRRGTKESRGEMTNRGGDKRLGDKWRNQWMKVGKGSESLSENKEEKNKEKKVRVRSVKDVNEDNG